MWWAIVTIASVGYGDMTPVTALGRIFGGVVILIGIATFAVPAGLLATGFAAELGSATSSSPGAPWPRCRCSPASMPW